MRLTGGSGTELESQLQLRDQDAAVVLWRIHLIHHGLLIRAAYVVA